MQLPRILTNRRFRPPPPPLSPSPPTNVNDDGPNVNDDGPKRQATAKISGNLWEPRQRHGQHEKTSPRQRHGHEKTSPRQRHGQHQQPSPIGNGMGNLTSIPSYFVFVEQSCQYQCCALLGYPIHLQPIGVLCLYGCLCTSSVDPPQSKR